mgnify:CR=1 FL=1
MTPFTHPTLTHPGIGHGFFGREGGVSEGIYAGLNCGVGSRDNAEHVAENRRRVAHVEQHDVEGVSERRAPDSVGR